jgi:hypothetical protein
VDAGGRRSSEEGAGVAPGPPEAKPSSGKFDRDEYHRNYMRDYMAKRRAKIKAEKQGVGK